VITFVLSVVFIGNSKVVEGEFAIFIAEGGKSKYKTDQAKCLGIRNPDGLKETGTDDKNGSAMVAASVKRLDCKNWS